MTWHDAADRDRLALVRRPEPRRRKPRSPGGGDPVRPDRGRVAVGGPPRRGGGDRPVPREHRGGSATLARDGARRGMDPLRDARDPLGPPRPGRPRLPERLCVARRLRQGIGFLRRRIWAWPVAFASAAGFGPIVLVLAMLPTAIVAGGFALFIADVVALLALARSYLGPR